MNLDKLTSLTESSDSRFVDLELCLLSRYLLANPHIFTEQQARWWLFNRKKNGIERSGAMIKKGGRWYVNVPRLREWILAGDAPV